MELPSPRGELVSGEARRRARGAGPRGGTGSRVALRLPLAVLRAVRGAAYGYGGSATIR